MKLRKQLLPVWTLAAFMLVLSSSSVRTKEQESTATLRETMDWIKLKLFRAQLLPNPDYFLEISVSKVNGCQISWRERVTIRNKVYYDIQSDISLDKADPFGVKYDSDKGMDNITIQAPNGKGLGTRTFYVEGSGKKNDPPLKTEVAETYISVPDKELGKRLQRAFEHAIKLCGGKTEPF